MQRRVRVCICFLVALAGCARERPEPEAGVETPAELYLDTVTVIYGDQLFNIRNVKRGPDGGFVVMNEGSLSVLLFDASGDSVGAFGRRGDGPGEFQSLTDLDTSGDSILILDALARRVSLFRRETLVTTWSIREMATVTPEQVVFASDGPPIVSADRHPSRASVESRGSVEAMGLMRSAIEFRRVDEPGRVLETPIDIPGTEVFFGRNMRGMPFVALPAFGAAATYDLTQTGVLGTDARDGRIVSFSWGGESGRTLRQASPPIPVTDFELDRFWDAVQTRARRHPNPEEYEATTEALLQVWDGLPQRPFYSAVISDGSETLIQHYSPRTMSDLVEWSLLGETGETLGTFSLDRAVRLLSLHAREILGVGRDAMDVEHVIVFRIRAASGTSGW